MFRDIKFGIDTALELAFCTIIFVPAFFLLFWFDVPNARTA